MQDCPDATIGLAIGLHLATVIPAAFLGAYLLARPKGTPAHRMLGKIWIGLMVVTSVTTFFIHTIEIIGPFSPIHGLSAFTLFASYGAVRYARQGNIAAHRQTVGWMYLGGIVIAGLFTFVPGRLMNAIVYGEGGITGALSLAAVIAAFAFGGWLALREAILPGLRERRKRQGLTIR